MTDSGQPTTVLAIIDAEIAELETRGSFKHELAERLNEARIDALTAIRSDIEAAFPGRPPLLPGSSDG